MKLVDLNQPLDATGLTDLNIGAYQREVGEGLTSVYCRPEGIEGRSDTPLLAYEPIDSVTPRGGPSSIGSI
jgi:hypothetical protein